MEKQEFFWLNGWIGEKELMLSENRAFLYGDGFFESMRWTAKGCPLWHYHWARMQRTFKALQFPLPVGFSETFLQDLIVEKLGPIPENLRVKLVFWRHGGGRYQPENTRLAFSLSIDKYPFPFLQYIDNVGIVQGVYIPKHPLSWIKTTSSMLYVAAAAERVNRKLDDLVLVNENGYVIEGSYSCLFWAKSDRVYIPNPDLGGLDSCMKRYLLDFWSANHIQVVLAEEKWKEIPTDIDWLGFGSGMGLRIKKVNPFASPGHILPES